MQEWITIEADKKDVELIQGCIEVGIEGLEGEQYDRMKKVLAELETVEPFA